MLLNLLGSLGGRSPVDSRDARQLGRCSLDQNFLLPAQLKELNFV
jgi:hypothetical protein